MSKRIALSGDELAAYARTMTATAANGLALMWEIVYIAASTRLPIVMPVVNRALSAPINIHCDHSDSMGARDSGWIQMYCENNQEVYESLIMAVRIAEHKDILLPVMVCQDGFITSHAVEAVDTFEDKEVKEFIGEYKPDKTLIDVDNPATWGPLDLQDYYFEHKRQQSFAMANAQQRIPEVIDEFNKTFGRDHSVIERYRMDDAEYAVVVLNSAAGTAKTVVDALRDKGTKIGLLKPRFFRPFPADQFSDALANVKGVAVLDRAETFSTQGGPMFLELKAALYERERKPIITDYIYGLGGRETYPSDIEKALRDVIEVTDRGETQTEIKYLGCRE